MKKIKSTGKLQSLGFAVLITVIALSAIVSCSGDNAFVIEILPSRDPIDAEAPVITVQPSNAVYSAGDTAQALIVNASVRDGGILSYQWYSNTVDSAEDGTSIFSAVGEAYIPPTKAKGVVYYYVIVTNTIIGNNYGGNKTARAVSRTAGVGIDVVPVSITGLSVTSKIYDGTADAEIDGTAVIDGLNVGDKVTVIDGTALFNDKNAGTGKTVTFDGWSLDGTDAGNYFLSAQPANIMADIAVKPVTITVSVSNKVYDGTTAVAVSGAAVINGKIDGDDVNVGGTAAFDDKNAGTDKTVTFGYSLNGADAGNYSLSAQPADITANITVKPVTITVSVSNKVYDGTTTATVNGTAVINGIIPGDDVSAVVAAEFDDKNAGTDKTVTFGYSLGGADAGNYRLTAQPESVTANITPAGLTVSASRALSPVDTTAAVTVNGLIGADTATLTLSSPPAGISLSASTLNYNGTTAFTNPGVTINFVSANSNYTVAATSVTVYDGQADYTGAGTFDRRIPVTQANINAFNTYARTTNGLTRHYKLIQNITLTPPSSGGSNWTAIGTRETGNQFAGSFDGQNYTIANLTINSTGDYQGMFGYIDDYSMVKNLGLVGGSVRGADYYVGGVVGRNSYGTVQNCYVTGSVSGGNYVGGVAGFNIGVVRNCYVTGSVTGSGDQVGGVVGYNYAVVLNCYATGSVTGSGDQVGGVVGLNCVYGAGTWNCYATGSVSGKDYVGGVVGYNEEAISNCVALNPNVRKTANNGNNLGRVFGYGSHYEVNNNYARSDMIIQYNTAVTPTNKTPLNKGLNNPDGVDVPAAQYNSQSWWRTASNWSTDGYSDGTVWDFDNVWEWGANNLPILRNVGGTQNHTVQ